VSCLAVGRKTVSFLAGPPCVSAVRDEEMKQYDFEVLRDGAVIVAERSIVLPELAAVWSKIAELGRAVKEPGCKIRVKDQAGRIVILVGVATARG
jgi:hypothetical protein